MNNYLQGVLFKVVPRLAWHGKSNLLSFALRPLITHAKLRLTVGTVVVLFLVGSAGSGNEIAVRAADTGGPAEIVLPAGEPSLKTVQALRLPLDTIEISQKYWTLHSGIDFRAPVGTPIWPIMPGVVVQADRTISGYGNLVVIQHDNGYQTWYGHMSKIKTQVGEKVDTSMIIGEVESTGHSTGPHLHLELREESGRIVNPGLMLGFK